MFGSPMHTTDERWLPVVGFPGYEVSSHGRVRGSRDFNGGFRAEPRILRGDVGRDGYVRVRLSPGRRSHFVHVLVLHAFRGPRPPGHQCRHFPDRTRSNNRLENLAWGTQIENEADKQIM